MHDLALALGGTTVQRLKYELTLDELKCWKLYEEEFGPFNLAIRMERVIGLAAAPHLKDHPFRRLAPWPRDRKQDDVGIKQAFAILAGAAAASKRRGSGKP